MEMLNTFFKRQIFTTMSQRFIFSLLIAFLFCSATMAQTMFSVIVRDKSSNEALPYPEIQLSQKLHKAGDNKGELLLPIDAISVGDTIKIRYMGYNEQSIPISDAIKQRGTYTALIEPKTFILNEVVISNSNTNGAKLYQKKKRFLLLPYSRKHHFNASYEYTSGADIRQKGNVNCYFSNARVALQDSVLMTDSLENTRLLKMIKRCSELNYFVADIFCHSSKWKKFYCDYKGDEKGLSVWEFTIRPHKTVIFRDIEPGTELICLVSIDSNGYIKRIETRLTPPNSDKYFSYILQTDYTVFNRQIINSYSTAKLLPNANYDERERIIKISFSDFSKG